MGRLDTPPALAADPHVRACRDVCRGVLAPAAERVDAEGVPRSHVDALAAAGLLGRALGTRAVVREVDEQLAAACGSTWLVATQHRLPLRVVAGADDAGLRERWLPPLRDGTALAGVAFSHLRRSGPPAVTAEPTDDGWTLRGEVPWLTSWGLADVFLVGAVADADVLWLVVPAGERPGFGPAQPLPLAAMGGTHTVRLPLDGLAVPAADLAAREPLAAWRARDEAAAVDGRAGVFGTLRAVVPRLRDAGAAGLADDVEGRAAHLRERAYALADAEGPAEERLAARTAALALAVDAAAALVALVSGRGMSLAHPAQRLAREALFHLVQGTTPAVRAELAARLAAGG